MRWQVTTEPDQVVVHLESDEHPDTGVILNAHAGSDQLVCHVEPYAPELMVESVQDVRLAIDLAIDKLKAVREHMDQHPRGEVAT